MKTLKFFKKFENLSNKIIIFENKIIIFLILEFWK
jgi:hypothetical protein